MRSHKIIAVREFLSPLPKLCVSGLRVAIVSWMLFTSCTPNAVQPSIPNTQSTQLKGTGASEINNALATLAMHTALSPADYQIGAEDLLQITLFNVSADEAKVTPRTQVVRVSQQGMISLPLIGELKVAGLTAAGLERELRKQYDKYIYSPQVGVSVAEYRQRISVIGAVQKTGVFELTGPKTVIDILSMAGGVSDKAGTQVHIYRQGPKGRESHVIDLLVLADNTSLINATNAGLITMPVQSGDVINVPPSGTYFVDGAVRRPGPQPLGRNYSLTQALAQAGGIDTEYSSSSGVIIYRRKGAGQMASIPVDFVAVMDGSAVDPPIQADDIILVPTSPVKYVFNKWIAQMIFGGLSISSFLMPAISGS
jgi:polysaccharide export outer membrane protein